jgi:hypothetical protein
MLDAFLIDLELRSSILEEWAEKEANTGKATREVTPRNCQHFQGAGNVIPYRA